MGMGQVWGQFNLPCHSLAGMHNDMLHFDWHVIKIKNSILMTNGRELCLLTLHAFNTAECGC